MPADNDLQPPFFAAVTTLATWTILFLFGHLRDLIRKRVYSKRAQGYAPIRQDYEDFYTRRMYYRIHDCWNRPIASAPDAWIDVLERTAVCGQEALNLTGKTRRCLNLGSYNYLGFAAADEYCTPRVRNVLSEYGCGMCSSRIAAGTTQLHVDLERMVADFVGQEDAITFGMGFATNSIIIPALVGKECLVLSDSLNHASIVTGVRGSGAKVKVFGHNDVIHLEQLLQESIAYGQPRTRKPWKKVLIIIEGIYSMEGEMCPLREVVAIKKKYKAYLFLDEAHSIGAMGMRGGGVCEHFGVSPADVDVMMGTFTKSFGSCGGYIAGPRALIQCMRRIGPGHCYASSMSPPAVEQVMSAMRVLRGQDGSDRGVKKIQQLRDNANYFRQRLTDMGCSVLGSQDSPVMPIMLFNPGKMTSTSRILFEQNIAMTIVGFPATALLSARARVCISASHTREDLDWALQVLDELSERCLIRYNKSSREQYNKDKGLRATAVMSEVPLKSRNLLQILARSEVCVQPTVPN
ncbi:hypothetical protein WJX82_000013 [Trebouxia sp. C0006]